MHRCVVALVQEPSFIPGEGIPYIIVKDFYDMIACTVDVLDVVETYRMLLSCVDDITCVAPRYLSRGWGTASIVARRDGVYVCVEGAAIGWYAKLRKGRFEPVSPHPLSYTYRYEIASRKLVWYRIADTVRQVSEREVRSEYGDEFDDYAWRMVIGGGKAWPDWSFDGEDLVLRLRCSWSRVQPTCHRLVLSGRFAKWRGGLWGSVFFRCGNVKDK